MHIHQYRGREMTKYQVISQDGTLIAETIYLHQAMRMAEHHIGSRIACVET